MAMELCRKCGNRVSTKASTCPFCGAPIKKSSGWGSIVCGCLILVAIGIFAVLHDPSEPDPPSIGTEFPYTFVKMKQESFGKKNVMELYAYSGEFDIENLKEFCSKKKSSSPAEMFYYVVIFDLVKNAGFPSTPFTAEFGSDFDKDIKLKKHIRAVYTYNELIGYSKLSVYPKSQWDSTPNEYDI